MPFLALPDGNAESATLYIADIAQAIAVPDPQGRLLIMLIKKNGDTCYVPHTEANIAYLASIGLVVAAVPSAIKVKLKP